MTAADALHSCHSVRHSALRSLTPFQWCERSCPAWLNAHSVLVGSAASVSYGFVAGPTRTSEHHEHTVGVSGWLSCRNADLGVSRP